MNLYDLKQKLWGSKVTVYEQELSEAKKSLNKTKDEYSALQKEHRTYVEAIEKGDWKQQSILANIYQATMGKKDKIWETVQLYRENYLYSGILQLIVDDSISQDPNNNHILTIKSDNSQFDQALKELQEKVDIDSLVSSIIEDALALGEYFIRVNSLEGEGVTDIHDDIDQKAYTAVYDGGLPKYFMNKKKRSGVEQIEPWKAIHFCYGFSKLRMKIDNEDRTLPEYVRIGKPFMWGAFNLLNYLDILTALVPSMYVQKMNSTSIIGVSVPDQMDPDDALKAAQRYETILNRFTEMDDGAMVTQQMLNAVGRFKVLPVWGDKGTLSKMDPRWDDMTDTSTMEDLRKSIMASVGVPYNFLFGGGGDKIETLKQFARYVRKLALIQEMVKEGVTQLALIHLIKKGYQPKINDIKVDFTKALIAVDNLDGIEFVDSVVSVIKSTTDNVMQIAQSTHAKIKESELQDFLNKSLQVVNMGTLFTIPEGAFDVSEPPQGVPGQPGQEGAPTTEQLKKRLDTMQKMLESIKTQATK